MRHEDDIDAEIEAVQRRIALEDRLHKLREEKRMIRGTRYPIDLTADEERPEVKLEQQQDRGTVFNEEDAVDSTHDNNGGERPWSHEQHVQRPDAVRRQSTLNRPPPALTAPLDRQLQIGGPQERLGSAHRPSMGFGGAYGNNSQQSVSAAHQLYMGGRTGQEDTLRRPPANEDQQWHQNVPDRGSAHGSFSQYSIPAGNSTAAHRNIAAEPASRHQQSFFSNSQSMFEPGPAYGPMQTQQEDQLPAHHMLRQIPSGRQDMMGRPLHMMGQMGPVRAQVTAPAMTAVENHRYDKHPTFQTLVEKPDGTGYWELRCYVCGGNVLRSSLKIQNSKSSGGQFFHGIIGFRNHIRICHPSELNKEQKISTATIVERCKVRELTHHEVIAMMHKHKGAAVRREHPGKKRKAQSEEKIKIEAKSRRTGTKSTVRDKTRTGNQQQKNGHNRVQDDHDQDQSERYQGPPSEQHQDDQDDSDYDPDADAIRRLTRAPTREQASSHESVPSVNEDATDRGEQPSRLSGIDATEQGFADMDASPKETWSSRTKQGHD